jgi:hypothetical protein
MREFFDKGMYESSFSKKICVVCPKCSRDAIVVLDESRNAKLICEGCAFSLTDNSGSWFGPMVGLVKRRCYQCGRWLSKSIPGPRHNFETILRCFGCGCEMLEQIQWNKSRQGFVDPYFGLPLKFIGVVKGHTFWAYNREHLAFMKSYVFATLRYRNPNQNSSLISRLPEWLLSSKNRTAVLKAITKLESL